MATRVVPSGAAADARDLPGIPDLQLHVEVGEDNGKIYIPIRDSHEAVEVRAFTVFADLLSVPLSVSLVLTDRFCLPTSLMNRVS